MDTLVVLSIGVFALGTALCTFFVVFLLRGKPVPGDTEDRQVVKYKDLELQTNSIMLILIVSTIVAVAPLALHVWLRLSPQTPPAPQEATIYLSGDLKDSSDPTAKLEDTPLKATNVVTKEELKARTDQEGHFEFDPIRITSEANRIKLEINKDGYSPIQKTIVGNEQNIHLTLHKIQR